MCQECASPAPAPPAAADGPSRRTLLKGLGLSGLAVLGLEQAAWAAGPDPALLTLSPRIRPRAEWAGTSCPVAGPLPVEGPGDVRFLLVHHTDEPGNAYAQADVPGLLRGMYGYHVGPDKRWADLAYNFVVDRYGGIWEGRAGSLHQPVQPAATGGSQGFAQLGCFLGSHSRVAPTPQAQASMVSLLAWLARKYGVDVRSGATATFVSRGSSRWSPGSTVSTRTVEGHRAMSQTTCPGDAAYPLVVDAFPRGVRRLNGAVTVTDRTAWSPAPGSVHLAERRSDTSVALRTVGTRGAALLGGRVRGAPLVVQRPSGPLEVHARGQDDRLWTTRRADDGTWTPWAALDGTVTGPPAAALVGDELHLFARAADGALMVRRSPEPGVCDGPWVRLGGHLAAGSGPSATSTVPGTLDVVVHGTDSALWHGTLTGTTWSGFASLGGGLLVGSPSAVAPGGELVVASVTRTGRAYVRTAAGWTGLGGVLFGDASLVAAPDGQGVEAYGTGTDGATYRTVRSGTTWSGWARL